MSMPEYRERPSPNHDRRGEPRAHRHAGAALYRDAKRGGGARPAVRSRRPGQRALRHRGGRHDVAAGGRGAARLSRRRLVLARRARPQSRLDRRRDRQSRARMGLSPVSRGADGGGRRALPRHDGAASDPARPRRRPFRHRARAQGRSRRTVRLAAPRCAGIGLWPPPAADPPAGAAAASAWSSAWPRSPTSPRSATASIPAPTAPPPSPPFSAASGRSAGTAGSTARPALRLAEVRAAYDQVRTKPRTRAVQLSRRRRSAAARPGGATIWPAW